MNPTLQPEGSIVPAHILHTHFHWSVTSLKAPGVFVFVCGLSGHNLLSQLSADNSIAIPKHIRQFFWRGLSCLSLWSMFRLSVTTGSVASSASRCGSPATRPSKCCWRGQVLSDPFFHGDWSWRETILEQFLNCLLFRSPSSSSTKWE